MEPLVEIFKLSALGCCAQESISFSKSSTRDIRVLLLKTSGPAVNECEDEVTNGWLDWLGYR